ncbi:hypothetical protein [Echinicola sp. 20G]|uniref:hypothetical protein n=1 Tax=Echinicola sp. 20G TaxID=2781961 RepID=UPI001910ECD0|nr:hypothetical protein [Echinicola sp. 20G]
MKSNPWIFGIVLLCLFTYWAWCNYELPLWGKSVATEGLILEITTTNGYGGRGYGYSINYAFSADDSIYISNTKLNGDLGKRDVGSKVEISYKKSNPAENKVVKYFEPQTLMEKEVFSRSNNGHLFVLKFQNGILCQSIMEGHNRLIEKWFEYTIVKDTIKVEPIYDSKIEKPFTDRKFLRLEDGGHQYLFAPESNRKYY